MVINTVLKRTGLGITQSEHVNTFVEAMPRDFKYGYLKGVENKRLDIRLIDQVRGQDGLIFTVFFFFFFRFLMDRDEVDVHKIAKKRACIYLMSTLRPKKMMF